LVTLGIGVDRVHDELVQHVPEASVLTFTQDTAPTHKSALKLMDQFYKTGSAVMVGTERMLPYLKDQVDVVVVASIDSILSLPAWRAHEHAHSILYALLNRAKTECIIETRKNDSAVMKSAALGSPMEFLRNEVKERRTYEYPPFATFVGVSWSGTEVVCKTIQAQVTTVLAAYDVVGPLPPEAIDRTHFRERAVIRLKPSGWPDDALIGLLKTLPPTVTVHIDPDEIV
jgi:primosomal protein N'